MVPTVCFETFPYCVVSSAACSAMNDRIARSVLAEHVPKNRRKLVGLEGEAHIAGPLDDKILGFSNFGDAGKVSLDIGREHRNSRPRKPLSHHLQRDSFTGSGSAGNETVAIPERERQPGWLISLSDKNFLCGISQLVIGDRHGIASSHASRV
jgi:hypothetical protein